MESLKKSSPKWFGTPEKLTGMGRNGWIGCTSGQCGANGGPNEGPDWIRIANGELQPAISRPSRGHLRAFLGILFGFLEAWMQGLPSTRSEARGLGGFQFMPVASTLQNYRQQQAHLVLDKMSDGVALCQFQFTQVG